MYRVAMEKREPGRYNGPWMHSRWAALNGVDNVPHPVDLAHPIMALVDARRTNLANSAKNLDRAPFDNKSFYRSPGKQHVSVLITAPYLGAAQRTYGSVSALNDTAHGIARDFGLFVRVGHPADTIHLSLWSNEPTVPIVFWNPERITLHLPDPADPYPSVAGGA